MRPEKNAIRALCLCLVVLETAQCSWEARPNFVVMVMDDMGWGDLGVFGQPARETPNLDEMASEGILFTDFYAASPVCSPSRAALLTGRLPIRNGFYTTNNHSRNAYVSPSVAGGIPKEELLIPEILDEVGYRNMIIGKWHLGHEPAFLPLRHGFHEFFGSPSTHPGPFDDVTEPNIPVFRDDHMIGRYYEDFEINVKTATSNITVLYTEEAVSFIRRQAARRQPFFLYWAPDSTHLPVYSSEAVRGQSVRGAYGDAVIELDRGVGAILGALRSTGVAENTFVFFTSDNGAATYAKVDGGSNGPLLCGKQTTFEGGVREPAIAWWPGTIPAGTVSRRPASNMDVLPTIAELAGAALPPGLVLDGQSLLGRVLGRDEPPSERPIFYYRGNELMAIRSGLYKAHFWCWTEFREDFQRGLDFCPGQSVDGVTSHEQMNYTQQPVLFHLGLDPGEKFPIPPHSSEYSEEIGPILAIYHKHRRSLVPGKPQLDWCDDAAMQWAPPGCEKIDRCLPVPPSRPYRCSWLY
ncbi:N-acetylgalactosamine-6-sulfatase-like [Dermacentor andersoni]|uniref:N-acetylgalactosamine-6-sulfatase-like n=1 Tax=Dermacentor andersoni TaxID=34620 RepID=UPI002155BCC9|nr:N-acetylgalactosamine-6-sulfatase-like [Dermacentor andersoni]